MQRGTLQTTAKRETGLAQGRRGLTLVELLVAMVILLVGIYAIARGFPALFGNIESERVRTQMAQRLEARMERLKSNPAHIPASITGHDPIFTPPQGDPANLIPTELYPDESADPVAGNPRDDLLWILGETFEVPIAREHWDPINGITQYYAVYPLEFGPAAIPDNVADPVAEAGDFVQVVRLDDFQRIDEDDVTAGQPLEPNYFYLDSDGFLHAPSSYDTALVDYVWVDENGVQHGVIGEIVDNAEVIASPRPVRAALVTAPAFSNVLPELSSARGRVPYATVVGQAGDIDWTTAGNVAMLESNYGATLMLPATAARQTLQVEYQQATALDTNGNPRRVPMMVEEISAPTPDPSEVDPDMSPASTVSLAFRGIQEMPELALFTENVVGGPLVDRYGNPLDPQVVYVLIVDTSTGETWTDADGWITVDFIEGQVTFNWDPANDVGDGDGRPSASEVRGRDLRIYYRTIAEHTIVVQKASDFYVYNDGDGSSSPITSLYDTYVEDDLEAAVDYRSYQVRPDPNHGAYTQLLFQPSTADQVVMVDYMAGADVPYRRVSGELHTIPGETLALTLSEPDVQAILSVRGVSMKVQGWWHAADGDVEMIGIDTFLTPEPLM